MPLGPESRLGFTGADYRHKRRLHSPQMDQRVVFTAARHRSHCSERVCKPDLCKFLRGFGQSYGRIVDSLRLWYGRCRSDGKFREVFRHARGYTANQRANMLAYVICAALCIPQLLGCVRAAASCGAVTAVRSEMKTLLGDCCSCRDVRQK
jgi:hypothetical protein